MRTIATNLNDRSPLFLQGRQIGLRKNEASAAAGGFNNLQIIADIMHLNDCKTIEQVDAILSAISIQLGFDYFLYRGRFHTGGTHYVEQVVSNFDATWREKYDKQRYTEVDPTVAHALTSLCPLVW